MEIPAFFDTAQAEQKWYQYWMDNGYFYSTPDQRTPYTIVIPPPNVTGVLHMGHMLNNTIQDVLIRRARLNGFNACWVPGTDHASIATEAKVVAKLRSEGIQKEDLSREEFLKHAWEWTDKHGGIILEQLKKLGASCDWKRTKFTMDPDMSQSVIQCFVDFYNKGLIYRGYRMVNWDPEAKTTLSDEEVIYEERQGKLYFLKYFIEDSIDYIVVATTRPETILGDTAVCVHPEDERYAHLKGKKLRVPIANRLVPAIFDAYVDPEFGTGCLKVTPAHDVNDKALGDTHGLEIIDIFNEDATLNAHGLHYQGKDRFVVREEIEAELAALQLLEKVEIHLNKVGTSERTKAVIEPRLSDQWFLKMSELVKPALTAVLETQEIQLVPNRFNNTYKHWLENIKDWNISRQLWWGQQIPAYYYGETKNNFVVAATSEDALELARNASGNPALQLSDLKQDPDALDTWFSSWLWPMSVFGGILNPDNEDFKYYYPTNDLVTGPDILFFWVSRMIFAGYEYTGKKPFTNVYLTGIVRDKQRRKMSKSLGNSPDPLDLIEKYGADGVRAGLLMSASAGNDILFDEELCQNGRSFANKIWNAFRLIKGFQVADITQPAYAKMGVDWYTNRLYEVQTEVEDLFSKYRLSEALTTVYKFIWDDFCSWYLEIIKPGFQQPIDRLTYDQTLHLLEENLKLLHPFMPFLSEEIWQHIKPRTKDEALIIARYAPLQEPNKDVLKTFETVKEVIAGIRTLRKEYQISFKDAISLFVVNHDNLSTDYDALICKMGNVSEIQYTQEGVKGALIFRVHANEYFVPIAGQVSVDEEIQKIEAEIDYLKGFLVQVYKKLHNEKFMASAPEKVRLMEQQKESDALQKIQALEQRLAQMR